MQNLRALSVRQPYAELIMSGKKRIEYRSRRTRLRERIYIYVSKIPGPLDAFADLAMKPGDLPTGMLIGTVEIYDCTGADRDFHWHLRNPERLTELVRPKCKPQPIFFYPF
jgi:hypothetical protein